MRKSWAAMEGDRRGGAQRLGGGEDAAGPVPVDGGTGQRAEEDGGQGEHHAEEGDIGAVASNSNAA